MKSSFVKGESSHGVSSSPSTASNTLQKRRALKSYSLEPPDYIISPQILMESSVEEEVKYLGVVANIPIHIDPTNRTEILKISDEAKVKGTIREETNSDDDAIFSLNAYRVNILKRDGESLLIQIAIHEIAAACYIKEESYHLIVLKIGDSEHKEKCRLVMLSSSGGAAAAELCALISQCFQLVYVEAIMHFFDSQLKDSPSSPRTDFSVTSRSIPEGLPEQNISFLTGSQQNLDLATSRKMSTTRSESELSGSATELIHEYFWTLHTKLNAEELKHFAVLLSRWNSDLPFSEFCQKVLELFGPERKHLLSGMRPFIAEKDYDQYEGFLQQMGIADVLDSPSITHLRKSYRRRNSENSVVGAGDEHDQMLQTISSQIRSLETNLDHDLNTTP